MIKRKLKLIAASAVACTVGVAYLVNAGGVRYGNADMNRLLRASPHFKQPSSYRTVEERQAWLEHNWRFANLWLARNEQDIVPEIIPFLDDPDKDLRERAAKALGRLEDVRAEEPLQQKLEQGQKTHTAPDSIGAADIPSQTLKLALGRIRARDLKGKAKLNKVAESVDLTYQGVGQLAQQLEAKYHSQDPSERRAASGSAAKGIVLEIVDVLYAMGKNGENIAPLKDDNLAFGPAIAMKLKAATLPLEQEIQLILDYTAQPNGGAFNESYLVELGPRATEMMVQRLEDMHRDPKQYNLTTDGAIGSLYLFRAAAMTGDPRVIPLLQQLESDFRSSFSEWERTPKKSLENWTPALKVYGAAQQARTLAEQKLAFPKFPAY